MENKREEQRERPRMFIIPTHQPQPAARGTQTGGDTNSPHPTCACSPPLCPAAGVQTPPSPWLLLFQALSSSSSPLLAPSPGLQPASVQTQGLAKHRDFWPSLRSEEHKDSAEPGRDGLFRADGGTVADHRGASPGWEWGQGRGLGMSYSLSLIIGKGKTVNYV